MINIPAKGQRSGYLVKCENCGKEIYQTRTQYNRAKHHFCSTKCQMNFQHNQVYEFRTCPVCDEKFEVRKKIKQIFCSTKCQNEWQKTNIGDKNTRFKGIITKCNWCNKELIVGKSSVDRFQNHFCSNSCRQKWYSNVYSQSEEWKEESRIRAVKILQNKCIDTNTQPQQKINSLLDKMGIKYTNEKNFKYYSMDNYLNDYHLSIEVMGDFWHTNPLIYNEYPSLEIQTKRIIKDKAKHTYVKNNYNHEILYLWESDINLNIILCEKIINKYIENNGILNNYNSFNYHLENNSLMLNSNIIYPYFDKNNKLYKNA